MIGVLDSGVGGTSVLKELIRRMPEEDFLYYGDNAHAPYGTKTPEQLLPIVESAVEWLLSQGAEAIVLACNTATAVAARPLRDRYPRIPILGIEPALKPASLVKENPRVLCMATPLTLAMPKYRALEERFSGSAVIDDLECPGLMELIEAGHLHDEVLHRYLRERLSALRGRVYDACVLGCTHYPHIRGELGRYLGPSCVILDGGEGTARETQRRMREIGRTKDPARVGRVVFVNSRKSAFSDDLARRLTYE